MYRRLRGGRRVETPFPYSKLHKSFEKGLGGKLFQKFSPKKIRKNFRTAACAAVGKWKRLSLTANYIKVLKRGLGENFFKSFPPKNSQKLSYHRLRGGREVETPFPYSQLHKSFEKGLGGKLFQKFSPKKFSKNSTSAHDYRL